MTITTVPRADEAFCTRTSPNAIRLERLLPGPIDRVWSYLTDPDKRAKWFAGGAMELRPGGAVTLVFRNQDLSGGAHNPETPPEQRTDAHVMTGLVTRCDPPRLLAFTWSADGTGTETSFELTPEGPDTRLVILQTGIEDHARLIMMTAGWQVHSGILLDLLSEARSRLFWPEFIRMRAACADRFPG